MQENNDTQKLIADIVTNKCGSHVEILFRQISALNCDGNPPVLRSVKSKVSSLLAIANDAERYELAKSALSLTDCPKCGVCSYQSSPIEKGRGICWNELANDAERANRVCVWTDISDGIGTFHLSSCSGVTTAKITPFCPNCGGKIEVKNND